MIAMAGHSSVARDTPLPSTVPVLLCDHAKSMAQDLWNRLRPYAEGMAFWAVIAWVIYAVFYLPRNN